LNCLPALKSQVCTETRYLYLFNGTIYISIIYKYNIMKRLALVVPFLGLLFLPVAGQSLKLDSVRQVVKSMGYDLPRLSPIPQDPAKGDSWLIPLNGTWAFSEEVGRGDPLRPIEVPGEWVMQGFKVKPGTYAEYRRMFRIPADWKGRRIKLRCDAVYSECEIFVNGVRAGGHLGGFTAFETDITPEIHPGQENQLSIRVRSESIADSLSSASQYAVHPLGGISRKIFLMALPEVNCSMLHVSTTFDSSCQDAVLHTEVGLANESGSPANIDLDFELSREGQPDVLLRKEVKGWTVDRGIREFRDMDIEVPAPEKWDPEHPNLYVLKMVLREKGKPVETVTRIFGFKQTEVRGNQIFVNNRPIKLRGVCRHEVMPLRGRSLSPGQWEEDVRLFREANVNYIRTSHYPPAPELVEACDRLGMFVEVEGPFCWAEGTPVPDSLKYPALIQPELEMVNTFRSDPSVLMWSIGNESGKWKEYFSQAAALIKAVDPTRPRNFSQYGPDGDNGELEVCNHHYPGPGGPAKYANWPRPITFDEYCHLNAYNRFELVTDPGIRDAWGLGFMWMWEKMYRAKGVLGGALWAGIDDSFFLPGGIAVGYGTWGPLDGWRRPKPEYWHVKKVYSPVKITQAGNRDASTGMLPLKIENRMLFSDLSECRFTWKAGGQTGTFKADGGRDVTATVAFKVPAVESVQVDVTDPRGVLIDQYDFSALPALNPVALDKPMPLKTLETTGETIWTSGETGLMVTKEDHLLQMVRSHDRPVLLGEALLMVLPLNGAGNGTQMRGDTARFEPFTSTVPDRTVEQSEWSADDAGFRLRVYDRSDAARGYTDYRLESGTLTVSYRYEILESINPRQVGLVFTLPDGFRHLAWNRRGLWNDYPADHIGRLQGSADATDNNPLSGPAGPSAKPSMPWAFDQNELGTNDFRSTKMNILSASLTDGTSKVAVVSDGTQSIRCWLENGKVRMLVADYSNMGGEGFFRSHAAQIDRPLKPGDMISGKVRLEFSN
jgi:beta-galactosidase